MDVTPTLDQVPTVDRVPTLDQVPTLAGAVSVDGMGAHDPVSLDDDRLTTVGLLAETFTGLAAKLAPSLSRHGLGDVEFEVLLRLSRSAEGSLRMSDLAAQTSMSTSGITRVVDRLAGTGLVERRACTTDRRATYAAVTAEGRARIEALLPEHVALIQRWLVEALTPAQLAALVEALRIVRDGVRPCAAAGANGPVDCPAVDAPGPPGVGSAR